MADDSHEPEESTLRDSPLKDTHPDRTMELSTTDIEVVDEEKPGRGKAPTTMQLDADTLRQHSEADADATQRMDLEALDRQASQLEAQAAASQPGGDDEADETLQLDEAAIKAEAARHDPPGDDVRVTQPLSVIDESTTNYSVPEGLLETMRETRARPQIRPDVGQVTVERPGAAGATAQIDLTALEAHVEVDDDGRMHLAARVGPDGTIALPEAARQRLDEGAYVLVTLTRLDE